MNMSNTPAGAGSTRPMTNDGLPIDCHFVQDMAAPYVLESVETDEQEAINEHLADCSSCNRLIREMQNTVSLLAFASRPVSPPITVKATLFARIAHAAQYDDAVAVTSAQLSSFQSLTLPASNESVVAHKNVDIPIMSPARRSWTSWALPLATLPLLLALGFVGFWGISTRAQLADEQSMNGSLSAEVAALNGQVNNYASSLASIDRYFRDNSAAEYSMKPGETDVPSDALGKVVISDDAEEATVMVWGLDQGSSQYSIYMETWDGRTLAGPTLSVDENGTGVSVVPMTEPSNAYKSIYLLPMTSDTTTDSGSLNSQPHVLSADVGSGFGQQGDTTPKNP